MLEAKFESRVPVSPEAIWLAFGFHHSAFILNLLVNFFFFVISQLGPTRALVQSFHSGGTLISLTYLFFAESWALWWLQSA